MTITTKAFTFAGRSLVVKAAPVGDGWTVRVFEDDEPVHPLVYGVTYETITDAAAMSIPGDLVEQLMQLAQDDVEQGRVRLINKKN